MNAKNIFVGARRWGKTETLRVKQRIDAQEFTAWDIGLNDSVTVKYLTEGKVIVRLLDRGSISHKHEIDKTIW